MPPFWFWTEPLLKTAGMSYRRRTAGLHICNETKPAKLVSNVADAIRQRQ
jgi:hypothetical protein